jgi:hypothetical protein
VPAADRERQAVTGISVIALIADAGGLALLIIGINTHFHNSSLSSVCGSTLGQIGQSMDQQAQAACSHADTMSLWGIILAIVGALVLAWGLKLSGSALLFLSSATKREDASDYTTQHHAPHVPQNETDWDELLGPIGVKTVLDLSPSTRRRVKAPLDTLKETLSSDETVERLMSSILRGAPGLLVVTDERLFFLDGDTGLMELEYYLDESTGILSEGVLTVEDHEGMAEFTDFEPTRLPPGPTRSVDQPSARDEPVGADVRICDGCSAQFTAALASYTCPGCGGILYQA